MILILSQEDREVSTERVMDWLDRFGASYRRVNGEDIDGRKGLSISCTSEAYEEDNDIGPSSDEVDVVWYRRWQHERTYQRSGLFDDVDEKRPGHLTSIVGIQLNEELRRISEAFFDLYDDAYWLSSPDTAAPNKLRVLRAAARHGLAIPNTIIADRRDAVKRFAESCNGIVAKPASDACFLPLEGGAHVTYTCALNEGDVAKLPEEFFPSLFQERLEKRYEIRVFVLGETCYPMAIFSQDDEQTEVDFRRYNFDVPIRNVPYALPPEVKESLLSLMDELGYETGSVDLIRTPDGEHVFLEVNPIGQYEMVSNPCNYHLHREVARHLAAHDTEGPRASRPLTSNFTGDASPIEDEAPGVCASP